MARAGELHADHALSAKGLSAHVQAQRDDDRLGIHLRHFTILRRGVERILPQIVIAQRREERNEVGERHAVERIISEIVVAQIQIFKNSIIAEVSKATGEIIS